MNKRPWLIGPLVLIALTGLAIGARLATTVRPVAAGALAGLNQYKTENGVLVGQDYHHDTSPPLRELPAIPYKGAAEHEANLNPLLKHPHKDAPDGSLAQLRLAPLAMPAPILNFDGIPFPGVVCNCALSDTNGEVGAIQYV